EDPAAGAVRDNRANTGRRRGMDDHGTFKAGAIPLSQLPVGVASLVNAAVFSDRRVVGGVDWAGPSGLRHSFNAAHKTDADLPADERSSCGSTSTTPHRTLIHRSLTSDPW